MSNIKSTRYVLAVQNLDASKDYYMNTLAFALMDSPPGWAFLKRGAFIVMLGECKDAISPKQLGDHSYFAYIDVNDSKVLYEELTAKGVTILKSLTVEPWGMKEFAIETIDGHRIMFGEDISNR